ncbi:hypothetical protein J7F01_40320 [Streptomyces sp. ISL-22]|uniref:hypothetical protein n=1 Tax=unclassified Streptomyces TaxID=2593676 RepID=UPI001BEC1829|nr:MULTISPECIES: hypothetical protein [unclassified Streptomyces]MBT2420572.1 hypothetical protein [Streptomyces sp. ISL-24]MBT2438261.1 hypothetical protein [Streptomyces sp. ISL-22]
MARSAEHSLSPERRKLRARIAATKRHHPDRPDLVEDDVRELNAARVRDFVSAWLADVPTPTSEQIERLRSMLPPVDVAGTDTGGGAAA